MNTEQINHLCCELNDGWQVSNDQTTITRTIETKNYTEAMSITQIVALLAEKENHHPDICLGWGYCRISFTTHSSKGLTELDFRCAKKLDTLILTLTK
ncbi:MAG: 4a-hydroxytetrahydrobiopterin dehydratase [Patiriisocius sp.]